MLSRRVRRVTLVGLLVAIIAGAIVLTRTGLVTPGSVRAWLDSLGPVAPILFVVTFVAGQFIGMPGIAFVIGGGLAFGPLAGIALGYTGGMCAATLPFLTTRRLRRVDGEPWRPRWRWLARLFELLEIHPIRAVICLRLLMWYSAPLSYALAFTTVPLRAYLLGCALALLPVTVVAVSATTWLAET